MAFPIQGPRFGPVERDGGPACAISLSDASDSPFGWEITVDALLEDWMRAGVLRTLPIVGAASVPYANAGAARAVGCCYIPGASAYRVSGLAYGPPGTDPANARAEIAITVGPPSGWQRPGLSRVNAWEDGAEYQAPPETAQLAAVPGPAVQIVANDPWRTRLVIVPSGDVFLGGAASVTIATGFRVPANVPFETRSHRAIFAAVAAGATITTWREGP